MKSHLFFFLTILALLITKFSPNAYGEALEDTTRTLPSVVSMQLRSDGKFDAICDDGSYSIVTAEDIAKNNICGSPPAVTVEGLLSLQRRSDNKFDVLCTNFAKEVATVEQIILGKACLSAALGAYGYYPEGSTYYQWEANRLFGVEVTIGKEAKVKKYGVVIKQTQDPKGRIAIYSNDDGRPGKLLASSPAFNTTLGRVEVDGNGETLSPGKYWLMWNFDTGTTTGTNAESFRIYYGTLVFSSAFPADLAGVSYQMYNYSHPSLYILTK